MFFNLKIHQNFKSWSTLQHLVMDYPVVKKFHSNMIVQRYSDGFFEQKQILTHCAVTLGDLKTLMKPLKLPSATIATSVTASVAVTPTAIPAVASAIPTTESAATPAAVSAASITAVTIPTATTAA
jgi:hypothetical protein